MRATLLRQRDQSAAVALEVYRERIVAVLDTQLKKGDKALIGNSAYRRYLRKTGESKNAPIFEIDLGKLAKEARFDLRPSFWS